MYLRRGYILRKKQHIGLRESEDIKSYSDAIRVKYIRKIIAIQMIKNKRIRKSCQIRGIPGSNDLAHWKEREGQCKEQRRMNAVSARLGVRDLLIFKIQ